jgi:hypothetical protein
MEHLHSPFYCYTVQYAKLMDSLPSFLSEAFLVFATEGDFAINADDQKMSEPARKKEERLCALHQIASLYVDPVDPDKERLHRRTVARMVAAHRYDCSGLLKSRERRGSDDKWLAAAEVHPNWPNVTPKVIRKFLERDAGAQQILRETGGKLPGDDQQISRQIAKWKARLPNPSPRFPKSDHPDYDWQALRASAFRKSDPEVRAIIAKLLGDES